MKLWGKAEHCYHWPYYFSWDRQREKRSAILVSAWVDLIRFVAEEAGYGVQLIAMEKLDQRICERILQTLPARLSEQVQTSYAGRETPVQITSTLRGLGYLVTSRYHASVLSMAGNVPQMALPHDERLVNLYDEIGLREFVVPHASDDMAALLRSTFLNLMSRRKEVAGILASRHEDTLLPRCRHNQSILREWSRGRTPPAAGGAEA